MNSKHITLENSVISVVGVSATFLLAGKYPICLSADLNCTGCGASHVVPLDATIVTNDSLFYDTK